MDVTKIAPLDAPPVDAATTRGQAGPAPQQGGDPLPAAQPTADRVDIHPLDIPAAMQILIAELRAGLSLEAAGAGPAAGPAGWTAAMPGAGAATEGPLQTARLSIQLLLDALPVEDADPVTDAAAVAAVDLKFQSAMDRALEVITHWPDVPRVVVDAAVETRMHVTSLTAAAAPPNSTLWPRPEWLGLAPGIHAFRRRRRRARGLSDPDFGPVRDDETERPANAGDRPLEDPP